MWLNVLICAVLRQYTYIYCLYIHFYLVLFLTNKHNKILYAVPYQHFTNSIENYF